MQSQERLLQSIPVCRQYYSLSQSADKGHLQKEAPCQGSTLPQCVCVYIPVWACHSTVAMKQKYGVGHMAYWEGGWQTRGKAD